MKQGMKVQVKSGAWAGLVGTVDEIVHGVVKIRYEAGKRALVNPETSTIVEYEPQQMSRSHDDELYCHYCGMPASDFGFFGEPVCTDCQ